MRNALLKVEHYDSYLSAHLIKPSLSRHVPNNSTNLHVCESLALRGAFNEHFLFV